MSDDDCVNELLRILEHEYVVFPPTGDESAGFGLYAAIHEHGLDGGGWRLFGATRVIGDVHVQFMVRIDREYCDETPSLDRFLKHIRAFEKKVGS